MDPEELARAIDRIGARELARALTWIENRDPRGDRLLSALPAEARGFRLGITGAPGVGKSSLVSRLVGALREDGRRVAVLAVDPTSPVTGGALLGDRIRMVSHDVDDDDGVFIRSLASRAGVGGLAECTDEAAELLSHAGYEMVLVETVGSGQLDLAILEEADRVFLLVSPESGDTIQYLKSGLLEVVDRVIVNKSDRPGAEETLRIVTDLAAERGDPTPLGVSCQSGEGFEELAGVVRDEAAQVRAEDPGRRHRARLERRLHRRVEKEWNRACWERAGGRERCAHLVAAIRAGQTTFEEALEQLAREGLGHEGRE